MKKNIFYLILCNLIGIILFTSWYMTKFNGFWFEIDKTIFYYFNTPLIKNDTFMYFVAFTNIRLFDLVSLFSMVLIYYNYYRKSNVEGKRWLFCIGIAMIFSAIILKQIDNILPIERVSASIYFENLYHNVNFVSQMSNWPTKDSSTTSFPGDHGMVILIFSAYLWKYFGFKAFCKGILIFIIFSLPRIMSGAHWFTDIYIGSISFILLILSWIILLPIADIFIRWLEKKIPIHYFIIKR